MSELKNEIERRSVSAKVEVRGTSDAPVIAGYAAVFNELSLDLGGFREKIAPGAFSRAIAENQDVRALMNHDPNHIVGRTKSGTLKLQPDDIGLFAEIFPPSSARAIIESVNRGDISEMSFGFRTRLDSWESINGADIRTLVEVDLFDVSIVTFPAYPQTSVAMRSLQEFRAKQSPAQGSQGISIALAKLKTEHRMKHEPY